MQNEESPGDTRNGRLLQNGVSWAEKRMFAWFDNDRRHNIVHDRATVLPGGHLSTALISICLPVLSAELGSPGLVEVATRATQDEPDISAIGGGTTDI